MLRRSCAGTTIGGQACGAPPLHGSPFCFWHDPAKADDLADAQRLGGQRRGRERTVATAFDFAGLDSLAGIRRLFEIAATDALALPSSLARVRAFVHVGLAALKLIEAGDFEERLAALEAAVDRRPADEPRLDLP